MADGTSRPGSPAEAIIAMSRALSLDVVAEGVETELQASELVRLGCKMAQGFYFSHPVRAEQITRMLQSGAIPAPRRRDRR